MGYYPIYSDMSLCFSNETIKGAYYLDINENPYTWKQCYEKCKACNTHGNETNMNCLSCETNLNNNFELIEGNCKIICGNNTFITPDEDCVSICPNGTYQYSFNNSCLYSCPNNYEINKNNKCILKIIDQTVEVSEFKNQIINDITSYVNSSKVFNGSNFLAVVLSSDNTDPKEQLKNGISAVDLGECAQIIKEHYNISKEESLIILNIESKNERNKKNESNGDKSFNLGKNIQLEVFDFSGRKLDLSVCKEDIKVMKYIGDVAEELNIQSAMDLAEKGIDVFNAADAFFNDLCHQYDSSDGKDIILDDRRTDIYKNATFCEDGCTYKGMDYDLMVANCICDSSILQTEEKNDTNKEDKKEKSESVNFKSVTKSFISNLLSFNFEVKRCYNLAINTKILLHNIGFYCLSSMFILQMIFFFIYLTKKLKSIKNFMLAFNYKNKTIVIIIKKIMKNLFHHLKIKI